MKPRSEINNVEAAFEEALLQPESSRIDWVRERFGTDSALRDQVLGLLAAQEKVGDFLAAPLLDFRGQRFGAYTAEEEVGRGGMSVVYKGRRADGDFEKQMAIKVLLLQETDHSWQGETQILARLEHPNIAQLFDAGVTPLGFRYLVMEYVAGMPITAYCEGRSETEKLQLFLDTCRAVQYAHGSLVVHRDVKPDNILVTGDGRLKLLDFGIAKQLTEGKAAHKTRGIQAYSPDYASPEQILGRPVTTATDVYSLGALLCELLTGKPPRAMAHLSVEELVEQARSEKLESISLQGDLLAITLKALRHDPRERYESAGALARDVERYLRRMPVEARAPTAAYVAGRFVRRHRYSVTLGALALFALMAVTGAAVVQARLANFRLSTMVKLQRLWMFQTPDETPGAASRNAVGLTIQFLSGQASRAGATPEQRMAVARHLHRIASAMPAEEAGAGVAESRAVEIARDIAGKDAGNEDARGFLVDSLTIAATGNLNRSEMAKAQPLAEEGLRLAEALAGPLAKARLARALGVIGRVYSEQRAKEKATAMFERSLELRKELHASHPGDPERQGELAEAHRWMATELALQRDDRRALEHTQAALRFDEERYAKNPREAAASVASDAFFASLLTQGYERWADTIQYAERVLSVRRRSAALQPDNEDAQAMVIGAQVRLATLRQLQGRWTEAHPMILQQFEAAAALHRQYPKDAHVLATWINLNGEMAQTNLRNGNAGEACAFARKTLAELDRAPAMVVEWAENAANQAKAVLAACPSGSGH